MPPVPRAATTEYRPMLAGTCTTPGLYHSWRLVTALTALCWTMALVGPAAAQTGSDRERALALFRDGSTAYRDGRFEEASRLFREAYATFPEPVLLYNLARSEENLGHWDQAADAYESYLAQEAAPEDRPGIERRVVMLRDRAAQARAEAEAEARAREAVEAPSPLPEPAPRELGVPWASIVTGAVGIAGIGVALALGQLAVDQWAQARDEQEHLRAVRLEAGAHDLALGANVAFGVAGTALLGAAIALILELAL